LLERDMNLGFHLFPPYQDAEKIGQSRS
jgi:hypothetical protein